MIRVRLAQWCGVLAALALFGIMVLTLVDVTGRKLLSASVPGSLELTELLMVVVILRPACRWWPCAASMWCSIRWTAGSRLCCTACSGAVVT